MFNRKYPPEFVKRAKGQNRSKGTIPYANSDVLENGGYKIEPVGVQKGKFIDYENLVVTSPDGTRTPAFRRKSKGVNTYLVTQDFEYMPVFPKKEA